MKLEFNLSEIKAVSDRIVNKITHKIILFEGDLGAGKTTLIKEICKSLGVKNFVNSPTFSIVNQYSSVKFNAIYHIDFYRINNLNEIWTGTEIDKVRAKHIDNKGNDISICSKCSFKDVYKWS